jgi:uncharacterized protein YukJ
MPVENYGVLKGRLTRRAVDLGEHTPHYHLLMESDEVSFHVAISARSALDHAELLYFIDDEFQHPNTALWEALPLGFTPLLHEPTSGAVDYIRGQIVDRRRFRVARRSRRGQGGLADMLDVHVNRALSDPSVVVYAFGSRWGPKSREIDRTFRGHPIQPSDGIHNVHMNQGELDQPGRRDDRHVEECGPWQDGALFIQDPRADEWVGIFLAFQSQQWHSDDRTGRPALRPERAGSWRHPAGDEPDFRIRIIAAMVNPAGAAPERETVTLLNPSREPVDLTGWKLTNTERQSTHLRGAISPREALVIEVSPESPLGNQGGTIGLLDANGLKVDGVAYTQRQAQREGYLITF